MTGNTARRPLQVWPTFPAAEVTPTVRIAPASMRRQRSAFVVLREINGEATAGNNRGAKIKEAVEMPKPIVAEDGSRDRLKPATDQETRPRSSDIGQATLCAAFA